MRWCVSGQTVVRILREGRSGSGSDNYEGHQGLHVRVFGAQFIKARINCYDSSLYCLVTHFVALYHFPQGFKQAWPFLPRHQMHDHLERYHLVLTHAQSANTFRFHHSVSVRCFTRSCPTWPSWDSRGRRSGRRETQTQHAQRNKEREAKK